MIDKLFWDCVRLLHWAAKKLGTTYEAVNVWFFCVIWPAFTLALIVLVVVQRHQLAGL